MKYIFSVFILLICLFINHSSKESSQFLKKNDDSKIKITHKSSELISFFHFHTANYYFHNAKQEKALEELQKIVKNINISSVYRDLAMLEIAMNTTHHSKKLINSIEAIAIPENTWYYTAYEIIALLYLINNNSELSDSSLMTIKDDRYIPFNMHIRAKEFIKLINH